MLRTRTYPRNGQSQVDIIPEGKFVEICDQLGDVAVVFHMDQQGTIQSIAAGSAEAVGYSKLFGAKFVKHIRLPLELSSR